MSYLLSFCNWSITKLLMVGCFSIFLYLFGNETQALTIAYIFLALDTFTGTIAAFKDRRFSSNKFGRVIIKFIVITVAFIVGELLTRFLGGMSIVEYLLASTVIFREASSILENLYRLDNKLVPMKVIRYFEKYTAEKFNS